MPTCERTQPAHSARSFRIAVCCKAQTKLTSDQNLDILKALMEDGNQPIRNVVTSQSLALQETDIRIAEVKRDAYEFRHLRYDTDL